LSIFCLEIWWDVVRHPSTPFCKLAGVGGRWLAEKWLETHNIPEIRDFALLDPQPKEVSTFLIIIAKLRSSQTFFV